MLQRKPPNMSPRAHTILDNCWDVSFCAVIKRGLIIFFFYSVQIGASFIPEISCCLPSFTEGEEQETSYESENWVYLAT